MSVLARFTFIDNGGELKIYKNDEGAIGYPKGLYTIEFDNNQHGYSYYTYKYENDTGGDFVQCIFYNPNLYKLRYNYNDATWGTITNKEVNGCVIPQELTGGITLANYQSFLIPWEGDENNIQYSMVIEIIEDTFNRSLYSYEPFLTTEIITDPDNTANIKILQNGYYVNSPYINTHTNNYIVGNTGDSKPIVEILYGGNTMYNQRSFYVCVPENETIFVIIESKIVEGLDLTAYGILGYLSPSDIYVGYIANPNDRSNAYILSQYKNDKVVIRWFSVNNLIAPQIYGKTK